MDEPQIFVDWITASQHHPKGGLPILCNGITVWYDRCGNPRHERASATHLAGSHETGIQLGCDGARVLLSGNPGRFSRQDNLFNLGWESTVAACNRILQGVGLPPFTTSGFFSGSDTWQPGARLHRLDITANFSTGNRSQARAVIGWLGAQSVSRMKRGQVGLESVWWANTRHMFKAYIKADEMLKHGTLKSDRVFQWCEERGVVRVEIELKRRLLGELGLDEFDAVTDEKIARVFVDQTEILRRVDRREEVDLIASIPARYRMTAAAWLAGQEVTGLLTHGTLYRHAKVLRGYGIDILAARGNVHALPLRVRVVDLQPCAAPEWYWKNVVNLKGV